MLSAQAVHTHMWPQGIKAQHFCFQVCVCVCVWERERARGHERAGHRQEPDTRTSHPHTRISHPHNTSVRPTDKKHSRNAAKKKALS